MFKALCGVRPDLYNWTSGLLGSTLVCDCRFEQYCSAQFLADTAFEVWANPPKAEGLLENEEPEETHKDLLNEKDDIAFDPMQGPSPAMPWPSEWRELVTAARSLRTQAFWELFAGCAILTTFFFDAGWEVLPPVDAGKTPCFNLLNCVFLSIVLGIVSEGRVGLLHLGTPCSTFSRILNAYLCTALRSREWPMGLPSLSPAKQKKVEVGNELANVSAILWKAQVSALGEVQWELPSSSLVVHHSSAGPLLKAAFDATRPVCRDGAPWQKYTTLKSSSRLLDSISAVCTCSSHRIQLRGLAPDGRFWTAHAASYWPEWCRKVAKCWDPLKGAPLRLMSKSAALPEPQDASMEAVFNDANFKPSGKKDH